jgi:hypothetical protein
MQNAKSRNLAWEFLRFVMEKEDFIPECRSFDIVRRYSPMAGSYLSINRTRFRNHAYFSFDWNGITNITFYLGTMPPYGRDFAQLIADQREQRIENSIQHLYNAMNTINYEVRTDKAAFNSLVYPDIWLLHSGQQDVARTLANIQSRLELYVAE